MKVSFLPFESTYHQKQRSEWIAGLDEAGRGSIAGPVVAAAVIFPKTYWAGIEGLADSKLLSARQREALYHKISSVAISFAVGIVDAGEIDRINILRASLAAMVQAVGALTVKPDHLLVDGNQPLSTSIPQTPIVDGDALCVTIAAASIIAKVTRDRMMSDFDRQYPNYDFAANKGYGTEKHFQALRRWGPCPLHRKTFAPVKEFYQNTMGSLT